MSICNCILAGTSACRCCLNNPESWSNYWNFWSMPYITTTTDWKIYNLETHELVEKKEAKITRVKEQISILEREIKLGNLWIKEYKDSICKETETNKEKEIKIAELKQELEQLEKENPK